MVAGWITSEIGSDIFWAGTDVSERTRSDTADVLSVVPPGVNIYLAAISKTTLHFMGWEGILKSYYFYTPKEIKEAMEYSKTTYGQTLRDMREADQANQDFLYGNW